MSDENTAAATTKETPQEAVAWSISFAPSRGKGRGASKKEKDAIAGHLKPSSSTNTNDAAAASNDNNTQQQQQQQQQTKQLESVAIEAVQIDEAIAVPRNLTTTREDLARRNHLDQQRWFCLSRPQYKRSCGVSSLTSVWNSLYSHIGYGTLPPISQEEVMTIIGFAPPFEQIRWGPFTGNVTLMRWFHLINKKKGVTGKSFFFWKPHGRGRTIGLTDEQAEDMVKGALRNEKVALVYHCKNHYMVPIGYQEQPSAPRLAMLPTLTKSETDTHLLIGEPSRGGNPSIHVRKFADVAKDLHTESPFTYNIRHPERGVEKTNRKKVGGTIHCFLGFRSDVAGDENEWDQVEGDDSERSGDDDDDDGQQQQNGAKSKDNNDTTDDAE